MGRYEIRYEAGKWFLRQEGDPTRIEWAFAKDRLLDVAASRFATEAVTVTVFRRNGTLDALWTFAPGETPRVRLAPVASRRWPRKDSEDPIAPAE